MNPNHYSQLQVTPKIDKIHLKNSNKLISQVALDKAAMRNTPAAKCLSQSIDFGANKKDSALIMSGNKIVNPEEMTLEAIPERKKVTL